MSYQITIRQDYRHGCKECTSAVENVVVNAIRNLQVGSITLARTNRCEHQTLEQITGVKALPGQLSLSDFASPPRSDTNGFDSGGEL